MAITTKALQDFIDATKKQLASITAQLAAITARLTKDEQMISSIQATLKIPPNTDPCSGVATISDSLSHPPPTSGAQAYDSMARPALGLTYQDSVFCKTVRRLSDIGANTAGDDLYAHCWGNADGTYILHSNGNVGPPFDVVLASNGSVVAGNQPFGGGSNSRDVMWHPTNADKYLYHGGTQVLERNVGAQTNTLVKDFSAFTATLDQLGGSVNWCDKTGNLILVSYNGFAHVYDRGLDLVYTGNIPLPLSTSWIGISPSGNHVISSVSTGNWSISYLIDTVAHTVDTTGIKFWNQDGDHGVPVSGSDGKDYLITSDSNTQDGLFRVDVTLDQSARTEAQQRADNLLLLANIGFIFDFHAAHGPRGAGQDWVFISTECINNNPTTGRDLFNGGVGNWLADKQEIIAVNYLTGAVRRLAHHRSRSIQLSYYYQPRLSCSWDASLVIWASNMNVSSPSGYSDFYAIANPLTA